MEAAPVLTPAARSYRGTLTDPARWACYRPRRGDIVVCTPSKCGTTWTQTIIAMLLAGGPDLPGRLSVISPWVDATLEDADRMAAALEAQPGRRVIKTHTPADGFPVWDGVHLVAVFRHPLDMFLSLRKHAANMKSATDHPMRAPMAEALRHFLENGADPEDIDRDALEVLLLHHRMATSGRWPAPVILHYADMLRSPEGAVLRLARALDIPAAAEVIRAVTGATAFHAMKARARDLVPEGGKGFWESDAGFFDSGGAGKWKGVLSEAELAAYSARMAALVPDPKVRRWLEEGGVRP